MFDKVWFNEEKWVADKLAEDNRSEEDKWEEYIKSSKDVYEMYHRSMQYYYWKQQLARLPFAGKLSYDKENQISKESDG